MHSPIDRRQEPMPKLEGQLTRFVSHCSIQVEIIISETEKEAQPQNDRTLPGDYKAKPKINLTLIKPHSKTEYKAEYTKQRKCDKDLYGERLYNQTSKPVIVKPI